MSGSAMQELSRGHVPYLLSWNLTKRCNLRCRHCYIDAASACSDELTTEEALRVLHEIAEVNREVLMILSGGEPLLRPDLDRLVSRSAALGMMPVLGTNGTLLTAEVARHLAACGLVGVGISLDSLVPERHDDFRRLEGAWGGAVRGIEAARGAGLDVQVQMTLTPGNLGELPQVAKFVRDAGARALTVFFLVCTGRGQDLVDLTPDDYERALRALLEKPDYGIMVRPRCAPTFRRLVAQADPGSMLLKSDAGRCMAGKNYCRITPDGDVTPCPYMPQAAGNLRKQAFSEIWASAPLLQTLRSPQLKGRCGACEYRDTCGGCRARAFASCGDVCAEDPWCTHVPGTSGPAAEAGSEVPWTPEAELRLARVPLFVRNVVRSAVEAFALKRGVSPVTSELMDEVRRVRKR